MDASDWKQLKALFDEARMLQEDQRRTFVEDVRRSHPDLWFELELLLGSHEEAPSYFEHLSGAIAPGPDPINLLTGQTVSHYEIIELLGEGGMGVVYKARHLVLGQPAALKFLSPILGTDGNARKRLIQEARAAYALDHPNICTIYDVGETASGQIYIAMALYEGETLTQKIRRGRLPLTEALDYASQICEGLAKAHSSGIVHGDVKPSNVMITHDGVVKLLDFGVADVAGVNAHRPSKRVGTVAYMSPERLEDGSVDHRTDIWSFGVVLHEMAVGSHPFRADGDSTGSVIRAILQPPSRAPAPAMHDIPRHVARVIERCLARPIDERYQTVAALFADLHRAKRETPIAKSASAGTVFLIYRHGAEPDERVAAAIKSALEPDREIRVGRKPLVSTKWFETLEAELESSEFAIVLLSADAGEMLAAEVEVAFRVAEKATSSLSILPVRLGYDGPFPYPLSSYLEGRSTACWEDDHDTPRLIEELREVVRRGTHPAGPEQVHPPPPVPALSTTPRPPDLSFPIDAQSFDSEFYVERTSDLEALKAIEDDGVTITVKGPRQMGKTSLLVRISRKAAESDKAVVLLDFQMFEHEAIQDADRFFRRFCASLSNSLGLEDRVESYWKPPVGNPHRCSRYMLRHVLRSIDRSLLLVIDNVERVFDTPFRLEFFSMLRSWHNNRAVEPELRRLGLVLATSTEPYELLKTPNLSPFNVGEIISLEDFSSGQVMLLNERYQTSLSEMQVGALTDLLHGHPYLVRKALFLLGSNRFSFEDLLVKAADDNGPFEDHLSYHLFRLDERDDLVDGLRAVLEGRQCEDQAVFWALLGAGLVRRQGRRIVPRCPLYSDYFRRRLLG